jgi:hypothetical protein
MEKIFSARLDEAALDEMERITRKLGITKRQFLEEAIHLRAGQGGEPRSDVWAETLGAWSRAEAPATTVRAARTAFRRVFERHHKGARARVRR